MSSSTPQPQIQKSNTGALGRVATFLPQLHRAESWAVLMGKQQKVKTKIARESAYMIAFDDMERWLVKRFPTLTKEEIGLQEKDDWFIFSIPEDDSLTKKDKATIQGMSKA